MKKIIATIFAVLLSAPVIANAATTHETDSIITVPPHSLVRWRAAHPDHGVVLLPAAARATTAQRARVLRPEPPLVLRLRTHRHRK